MLLRCRKDFYQLVWSALPFITCLENKGHRYPCFFNTLHVGGMCGGCCHGVTGSEQLPGGWVFLLSSENKMFLPPPIPRKIVTVSTSCCPRRLSPVPGTIRTCQKFLIQYNRRQLLVLLQNCTDEGKQCQASAAVTEAQGVT